MSSERISDVMTKDVIHTIPPSSSAHEAAKLMKSARCGCLVIVDKGQPVGVVTERDLVGRVMAEGLAPQDVKVTAVMSRPVITIGPEASLPTAAKVMITNSIRRLVVTEGTRLVGIVTVTDFAKLLYRKSASDPMLAAMARAATLLESR